MANFGNFYKSYPLWKTLKSGGVREGMNQEVLVTYVVLIKLKEMIRILTKMRGSH
jgi:hypothetical protein